MIPAIDTRHTSSATNPFGWINKLVINRSWALPLLALQFLIAGPGKTEALPPDTTISASPSAVAAEPGAPAPTPGIALVPEVTPDITGPIPTIASRATPKPGYLKLLELQLDIAERSYAMEASNKNLAELVNAHQQILTSECFGLLRDSLEWKGYPESEECRARIQKVLDLDGSNPIALCSKHGIDSAECQQSSNRIKTGSYVIDTGGWRSSDNQKSGTLQTISLQQAIKLKSSNKFVAEGMQKFNQKLYAAKANPRDPRLIEELEVSARSILNQVCIEPKLALEPTQASAAIVEEAHDFALGNSDSLGLEPEVSTDSNDPLSSVIKSLEANRPTPIPTAVTLAFSGPAFTRYRLVTDDCEEVIIKIAGIYPQSSVVQCFRFGPVSPSCIQAKRSSAHGPTSMIPGGSIVAPSGGAGFSSF